MDELPSAARALLELAKDGHEPPNDDARARVRKRLAVALTAAAAGGAPLGGAPAAPSAEVSKGLWGASATVKGWVAAVLVVAGVGGPIFLASKRENAPRQNAAPAAERERERAGELRQPTAQPLPRRMPPQESEVVALPTPVAPARQAHRTAQRAVTRAALGQETELLARAARRLAHGDVHGARALLDQHRRAFENPLLREERDGLLVLARCMEAPDAARDQARHFLARAPEGVLVARIERACGLNAAE